MSSLEEMNSPFGGAHRIPCDIWGETVSESEAAQIVDTVEAIKKYRQHYLANLQVPGYYTDISSTKLLVDGQYAASVVK